MDNDQIEDGCSPDDPKEALKTRSGIVQSWVAGIAKVQIFQSASFGEAGVVLSIPHQEPLTVGQRVRIEMKRRTESAAMWIGFLFPLALLGIALTIVIKAGGSELQALLAALGVVVVWYGSLLVFKKRVQNTFAIQIVN